MHDAFQQLDELTARLVRHLDKATFDDIERFMQERSDLIDHISKLDLTGDLHRAAGQMVQNVLVHDKAIMNRMMQLRNEASEGLSKLSTARVQRSAYDGGDAYNEGLFFDRKK
ncbi:flagellar protein FliT [Paenibacillus sp. MBLB4367]|uniref:flagellar protein FliT n=1 Tax=Paenibacillus sp. MBLB4367 TaxID=3384767 RepID=UPI0039080529